MSFNKNCHTPYESMSIVLKSICADTLSMTVNPASANLYALLPAPPQHIDFFFSPVQQFDDSLIASWPNNDTRKHLQVLNMTVTEFRVQIPGTYIHTGAADPYKFRYFAIYTDGTGQQLTTNTKETQPGCEIGPVSSVLIVVIVIAAVILCCGIGYLWDKCKERRSQRQGY